MFHFSNHIGLFMLFKKDYENLITQVPEKFRDKVDEFLRMGYSVKTISDNKIEMDKWRLPPLTFLFYFSWWPLIFTALLPNYFWGYHYGLVIEDNGEGLEVIIK